MRTKWWVQFWSVRFRRWVDLTPHDQEQDANTIAAEYRARQKELNGKNAEKYRVDAVEAEES